MSANVRIAARSVQFWTHHSAPAFTCFSLGSLFVRPATGGWFVGKDVATILGYSNPRDAISKHVDDEDKGVAKCDTLGGRIHDGIPEITGLGVACLGRVAQAGGVSSIQKIASLSPLSPLISVALVAKVALVA